MTFPKRKKSSRFQTILIKKKEKHLQLCQMSAKDTTQSLSHAYTDTCNGGAVLHTKATTAAIAGCIQTGNHIQIFIVDVLVIVSPQAAGGAKNS